ncbi:MAG: discoidin domain-containing protein [Phycisphaerales bacterium]|nr:MAG: discoidin domain-containing protein [Phycisphaerales bacterium]
MCKKSVFLISLVFVLGPVWAIPAEAAVPDLVAWWTFDEGSGTTAADSSGRDMHGVLGNDPVWDQDGVHKGCLFFDGDLAHVRITHQDSLNPAAGSFTFAFWANVEATPGTRGSTNWDLAVNKRDSGSVGYYVGADRNQGSADQTGYRFMLGDTAANRKNTPYVPVPLGEWVFVAAVLDRDQNAQKISVDGGQTWATTTPPPGAIAPNVDLGIGWDIGINNYWFRGRIDDVALFSRALTPKEVLAIYTSGPLALDPTKASKPNPDDEATDVPRDVALSWTPGEFSAPTNGHRIYFGESFNDVNDGIGGITLSASNYDPGRLGFETTYYWRVDEVNAPPDSTVFPGEVWSFTTEPVGNPIDGANITATASSAGQADLGPENTIDGSGLDENDLHSTIAADMWLSGNELLGAWIQYEFDKVYRLHELWVWNSNQELEAFFGLGMKDVAVEYSTNGTEWTALVDVPEFVRAPGMPGYAHDTTVDFGGAVAKYVKLTASSNWGGVLPQYGLSEVRFFAMPVSAREPSPDSGATDVSVDAPFAWRAGREAATHTVFLSTDRQAVIDGAAPAVSVTDASYSSALDLGQTYYWRIDEVNEVETPAIWQGDVWDFTTQEFIVVEDFEDYNDWPPHEIYTTWLDGYESATNGSQVGNLTPPLAETTIVHSGAQSMPLFYSNTGGATYSEGERTFVVPQDWTKHGVQTLGLWFAGTVGNTGTLYVKVRGSKVVYDGDVADLERGWQPWNIELASFGVNLQSVTTLAIGIDGNGVSGTLYFDDIRLYPYGRQLITPAEPNNAGLIGHWKFDGDTLDSSGLGHHGTINGDPTFAVGRIGQAISFDGMDDYVVMDSVTASITNDDITLAGWVKTTDTGSVYWFSCNGPGNENVALFGILGGQAAIYDSGAEGHSSTLVNDDNWHHLVYSRVGSTGYVYVDGNLENTHTANFTFADPGNRWSIGQEWDGTTPSNFLGGTVDDARIYDYGLSYAEVAGLAGRTLPFDKPF